MVASLLCAIPATVLGILFVFSGANFSPELITCSLKTQISPSSPDATCDTYKLADYNFINGYCYSNMVDYEVNLTTGELAKDGTEYKTINRGYMKLFPYVIFSFSLFGVWVQICWAGTSHRRAAQAEYLLDGIAEAIGELMATLRKISKILNYQDKYDGEILPDVFMDTGSAKLNI